MEQEATPEIPVEEEIRHIEDVAETQDLEMFHGMRFQLQRKKLPGAKSKRAIECTLILPLGSTGYPTSGQIRP